MGCEQSYDKMGRTAQVGAILKFLFSIVYFKSSNQLAYGFISWMEGLSHE